MEKKKKQDYNSLTAMVTILIGIIYGILTLMTPKAPLGNPMAPLYFPLGLATAMIVLGIVLFIKSDFSKTKEALEALKKRTQEEKMISKLIIVTSIASCLYAFIFEHVGFVIATFLFMEFMLFITNGKEKWLVNTIVSLCFSVGIFFIFNNLLGVILPPMPFM